ncbi:MAG: transporter substrate-binding domain-containing protein [Saccharospirillaceae bacterium]|nr:transporter substrate-binding domain-containing protein [Saccharospirillaceae bacterium]
MKGIEYQYLMALADAADCRLVFVELPWIRALQELEQGNIDVLYGASHSPERNRFATFSRPYRHEEMVLVTHQRRMTTDFSDWAPRNRIGLIRGFQYPFEIERILAGMPEPQKTIVSADDQLLMMILADRIDGYLVERIVADWQRQQAANTLQITTIAGAEQEPMHLMLSKQLPDTVLTDINSAIESIDYPVTNTDIPF